MITRKASLNDHKKSEDKKGDLTPRKALDIVRAYPGFNDCGCRIQDLMTVAYLTGVSEDKKGDLTPRKDLDIVREDLMTVSAHLTGVF